ncbi:MAG: hypothetical protein ABW105_06335 [Candidatus Thiodiazotropha sp. 6PLUC1]
MSDPEIGWIYKPYSKIFHTREGWAVNETNSMGFNDREIVVSHDKKEVLVLGDSFTEALQVKQANNFTSLVEQTIPCVDVINAGRSGLSPVQYDTVSKRFFKAAPISQVIVVLNYSDMHDILSTNATIIRDQDGEIIDIELHERQITRLRQALDTIFSNSALASYLKDRVRMGMRRKTKVNTDNVKIGAEKDEIAKLKEILNFMFTRINKRAPLGVVYIPSLKYMPNREIRHDSQSALFERIIKEITEMNNIPYRSTMKQMELSYKENSRPPVGFSNNNIAYGHLNEHGHESVKSVLVQLIGKKCSSALMLSGISH